LRLHRRAPVPHIKPHFKQHIKRSRNERRSENHIAATRRGSECASGGAFARATRRWGLCAARVRPIGAGGRQ
jgi:hypothetical protein